MLGTYNAGSAYVTLEEWSGVACGECGYSCNSDDLFYCPACHNDFCESCIGVCDECQDSYCGSCLEREHHTGRNLCTNCRAVCPNCGHIGSASDIEEHGLCGPCREEQQQKEKDHEEQQLGAQADAA